MLVILHLFAVAVVVFGGVIAFRFGRRVAHPGTGKAPGVAWLTIVALIFALGCTLGLLIAFWLSASFLLNVSGIYVSTGNFFGTLFWFMVAPFLYLSAYSLGAQQDKQARRVTPNSAPHRDGREAAPLGQSSSAPARGRER
jgi:fatty acid desaturase